jgi:hypothetical protein
MKPSDLNPLRITDLAVKRWLEHVSLYGDETEDDVRREFADSVPVPRDEQLPFPRMYNSLYFKLRRDRRVYFIVEDMVPRRGYYLLKTIVNPQNWHPSWRDGYRDAAPRSKEDIIDSLPGHLKIYFRQELRQPAAYARAVAKLKGGRDGLAADAVRLIDSQIAAYEDVLRRFSSLDACPQMTQAPEEMTETGINNAIAYLRTKIQGIRPDDAACEPIYARIRTLARYRAGAQSNTGA